ncbi:hypothetical protein MUB24_04180 [Lederbergia sp. NSJ-179]|uniref:hypothetical protein n=1 Tax=Lederbergia sp. NSJ-179 TaxID=2931402 RepID=UPI001FD4E644|nr:hypothetical protein [Lederbergia sp. NSJ-179]MCJ7840121.1 hypothetical protein [Lederbergia sp. NSJ-179]
MMDKQMFPSIRLHYMGVNRKNRNKGYGKMLLLFALDTCLEISENVGCVFVTLEALEGTVGFKQE